jgi:hypothetical protein
MQARRLITLAVIGLSSYAAAMLAVASLARAYGG